MSYETVTGEFQTGRTDLVEFPWGPVVRVHEVDGLDLIVEHFPEIFKDGCGTKKYDYSARAFMLATKRDHFVSWEGFDNLHDALLAAISVKRTGSSAAAQWMKLLLVDGK